MLFEKNGEILKKKSKKTIRIHKDNLQQQGTFQYPPSALISGNHISNSSMFVEKVIILQISLIILAFLMCLATKEKDKG